jgi:uncharacterized protein
MNERWKIALASVVAAGVAAVGATALSRGGDDVATATVPPASSTPPDTSQPTGDAARSVSVTGHGTVDVTPDIADMWLGVQVTAPTGDAVMSDLEKKSQALVKSLKSLGIADEDIQTSDLSLYPNYKQDGTTVDGYTGSVNVTTTVHDIDRLGEILDAVQGMVGDGLTIGGISFSYEDPEAVLEQARVAAMDNARARAEQYATAADAEIGAIIKIVETPTGGPVPYAAADMASAEAGGARVAIEPGSQELAVDVTVVFELV